MVANSNAFRNLKKSKSLFQTRRYVLMWKGGLVKLQGFITLVAQEVTSMRCHSYDVPLSVKIIFEFRIWVIFLYLSYSGIRISFLLVRSCTFLPLFQSYFKLVQKGTWAADRRQKKILIPDALMYMKMTQILNSKILSALKGMVGIGF